VGRRVRDYIRDAVSPDVDLHRQALGRVESWQRRCVAPGDLADAEFRVFSQANEDGIIQHLVRHTPIAERSFIEFGVQDYHESNTRFLLVNDNWRGLVIDPAPDAERWLTESGLAWFAPIEAVVSFVTRDNIDDLFTRAGFAGDIGLMSIDVDGNDYWLWEACEAVSPRIVVCEYNGTWGLEHKVTVPYQEGFTPAGAHPSRLHFGASLPALVDLAGRKGYDFVGCESHGANAFFVRSDVNRLPPVAAENGYRYSTFRMVRTGRYSGYLSDRTDRLRMVRDCLLEDVVTHEVATVADLFGV
jgi:hypothetical protein